MKVVAVGLREVYGYNNPLPADDTSVNYYDDCLLWIRDAVQWLIRFSRREQSVVLPISVKDILKKDAWEEGRKRARWTFPINQDVFEDLKHIRLRGISAFIEDRALRKDRLWRIQLRLPQLGNFDHIGGGGGKIPQADLPGILLGRVAERDSRREPDIVGVTAVHNAGPIGEWEAVVLGAVPAVEGADDLADMILDLHCSFRQGKEVGG